jgi:hypothetical protein
MNFVPDLVKEQYYRMGSPKGFESRGIDSLFFRNAG